MARLHVPSFEFDSVLKAERQAIAVEVFLEIFGQVSEGEQDIELASLLRKVADQLEVR